MPDPIVDPQYGKPNWTDFVDNWREKDAEWLRDRTIMRFPTATARDIDMGSATAGTIIYRADTDQFEAKRAAGTFQPFRALPQNLAVTTDSSTSVLFAHSAAGGLGLNFTPTALQVNATAFSVLGGILGVDSTGVTVKTGTKTAKLTTSATDLVSDTPLTVPSLTLSGSGTVLSAAGKTMAVGTVTADTATIANASISGTATIGVANATSGTIGGVSHTSGQLGAGSGATGGMQSGQGHFYGDANSALVRQRPTAGGTWGTAYFQAQASLLVTNGDINQQGGYLSIMNGRGVRWFNAAGTHVGWISPVIYQPTDPGATNFPDGTIWAS